MEKPENPREGTKGSIILDDLEKEKKKITEFWQRNIEEMSA